MAWGMYVKQSWDITLFGEVICPFRLRIVSPFPSGAGFYSFFQVCMRKPSHARTLTRCVIELHAGLPCQLHLSKWAPQHRRPVDDHALQHLDGGYDLPADDRRTRYHQRGIQPRWIPGDVHCMDALVILFVCAAGLYGHQLHTTSI